MAASSSTLPVPIATEEMGSSATRTGMPVSSSRSRSVPLSSAPPPVRVTPRSMVSAASSLEDARARAARLTNQVGQHLARHGVVGNDPVAQRPLGDDAAGRATQHRLRILADRQHLAARPVCGHHRRLPDHDPAPVRVDHDRGCAQVYPKTIPKAKHSPCWVPPPATTATSCELTPLIYCRCSPLVAVVAAVAAPEGRSRWISAPRRRSLPTTSS